MSAGSGLQEYLDKRLRQALTQKSGSAKSWLITSCFLFPDNFSFQFEAYLYEKDQTNVKRAAELLNSLFATFSHELRLCQELDLIVDCLRKNLDDDKATLVLSIFDALPDDTRRNVLLDAASRMELALDRCQLLLITFDKFPDLVSSRGEWLLNLLCDRCKNASSDDQLQLLCTLIMEVCPKVLPHSELQLSQTLLRDLLTLALELLVNYVSPKQQLPDLVSESPWTSALLLFEAIGQRLGWSLTRDLHNLETTQPEKLYQNVVALQKQEPSADVASGTSQLFYVSSLLFLKHYHNYMQLKSSSILVEAFVCHSEETIPLQQIKRRRTTDDERHLPIVTCSGQELGKKTDLVSAFMAVAHYYDLIHQDPAIKAHFYAFKSLDSDLFAPLCFDIRLYQGSFRGALAFLHAMPFDLSIGADKCRKNLLHATLCFCLADHVNAADHLVQAVASLTRSQELTGDHQPTAAFIPDAPDAIIARQGRALRQPTVHSRHVHFLLMNRQSILAYCSRLLIHMLKDRSLKLTQRDADLVIGHVIVLAQYTFPEEEELFALLMNRIRVKECFSYPAFCNYVVHIYFLEEFAFLLLDPSSPDVALDITPSISSQRRMGTRGANRGEKQEFHKALMKQALKCYDSLDQILIDFLIQNRSSLMECLV